MKFLMLRFNARTSFSGICLAQATAQNVTAQNETAHQVGDFHDQITVYVPMEFHGVFKWGFVITPVMAVIFGFAVVYIITETCLRWCAQPARPIINRPNEDYRKVCELENVAVTIMIHHALVVIKINPQPEAPRNAPLNNAA